MEKYIEGDIQRLPKLLKEAEADLAMHQREKEGLNDKTEVVGMGTNKHQLEVLKLQHELYVAENTRLDSSTATDSW